MICKATLIGRITNDLVLVSSKKGNNYIRFSLACNEISQGAVKTCFLNCICFGNTATNLKNYCSKGSLIFVDGAISQNTYKNKQDVTIRNYTIICNQIRFLQSSNRKGGAGSLNENKEKYAAAEDLLIDQNEIKRDFTNKSTNKESTEKDINFADDIDWDTE